MFRCTVSREEKRTDEEILEMAVRGSKQQNRKLQSNRDLDQSNNIGNGENNLLEKRANRTYSSVNKVVALVERNKKSREERKNYSKNRRNK